MSLPDAIDLIHICPETNCWRFYRLSLQDDLFGGVTLVRQWGRIGTSGQAKQEFYSDRSLAQTEMKKRMLVKLKRGYLPKNR